MNKNLTLIEGTFTPVEAKEILMSAFSAKFNYHQLKNVISQEKYGKDDVTAQKRIPELQKELAKLQEIIDESQKLNKKLKVHSSINISISDE
jgi:hypothetical protein